MDFYHIVDDMGNLRKYEFSESEERTMKQKMSREELIDLTEALMTFYDKTTKRMLTDKEQDALAVKFDKSINHPGVILVRTPLPTTTIAHRCAANHFATPSV